MASGKRQSFQSQWRNGIEHTIQVWQLRDFYWPEDACVRCMAISGESERLLMSADSGFLTVDPLNIERIDIFRLRAKEPPEARTYSGSTLHDGKNMPLPATASVNPKTNRDINSFKVKFGNGEEKELLISKQKGELPDAGHSSLPCRIYTHSINLRIHNIYIRNRNRLFRLIVEQQKEFTTRQNKYALISTRIRRSKGR